MTDDNSIPFGQIDSARKLPLNQKNECLLSVIAPMLVAMQEAESGHPDDTIQLYNRKQVVRDCIESLCRPLNADETQHLFVTTLMTLCERLVASNP